MLRSFPVLGAAVLVAAFLFTASAHAAQINGDPLLIASDETGRLGVAFAGTRTTEFCCTHVNQETGEVTTGNAGFDVVVRDPDTGSIQAFGRGGQALTPTSAPAVTGSGSNADPFRLRTTWAATDFEGVPLFELRQELRYTNGAPSFEATYEVQNVSGAPLQFRAAMGADLYGGGSDSGAGLFEPGPPRFVGGLNPGSGAIAGLFEMTPWHAYEEGQYGDVLFRARGDWTQGENLRNTIEPNVVDNGVAVQWDTHTASGLAPQQTARFDVAWRFPRSFSLTPEVAEATTGDEAPFEVSVGDTQGQPRAGVPVRWTVIGINAGSGTATTGADGKARIDYVGANPGSDFLRAYADLNANGQRDTDEPEREASITWTGPDAPTFAREVNLKPVSGVVRYRLPRRGRGKVNPAASKFIRLAEATQIPVGAELDASRGRVQLTTAQGRSTSTGVQSMQAYSGRFVVTQPRRGRGVTDLRMTAPLKCKSSRRASRRGKVTTAAKRRSRRLWTRGRGRFRTRGRHSSATVRGTMWLTKDTCTTTTTAVKEGVVIVRDFGKRKNVRVKAGKRYVARARARRR